MNTQFELTSLLGRPPETLRVWLVHDWLTGMRGGEKVLLQLVRLFPRAKIATLFHIAGSVDPAIEERIHATSFLQRVPRIGQIYRRLLPVMPEAIKSIAIDNCDLVISTSHCVAKGISVPRNVPHLCYCFTPMRYAWETAEHYFTDQGGLTKRLAKMAAAPLRKTDLQLNESVTRFATTCRNVADRIQRCYGRPADVVYPGVDEVYLDSPLTFPAQDNYLIVSALVPYKRIDLAMRTFAADPSRHLLIVGKGSEKPKLKALAGAALNKTIIFADWQSDAEIINHYANCRALLFPGEEDFGIVPLEAQACGRPVIAYGAGGVRETIIPLGSHQEKVSDTVSGTTNPTGVFFDNQTPDSLAQAIHQFESHQQQFNPTHLRANAHRFTWHEFHKGICVLARQLIAGG